MNSCLKCKYPLGGGSGVITFACSISEENFWRNYFYRVSLICQANELSFMSREGDSQSATETVTSEQQIGERRV